MYQRAPRSGVLVVVPSYCAVYSSSRSAPPCLSWSTESDLGYKKPLVEASVTWLKVPANAPPSSRCWNCNSAPVGQASPAEGLTVAKTVPTSLVVIEAVGSALFRIAAVGSSAPKGIGRSRLAPLLAPIFITSRNSSVVLKVATKIEYLFCAMFLSGVGCWVSGVGLRLDSLATRGQVLPPLAISFP